MSKVVKVMAKKKGFYENQQIAPGQVFDYDLGKYPGEKGELPKWVKEHKEKDAKAADAKGSKDAAKKPA